MQTSFSACANMQAVRTQAHVTDRRLSLSVKCSKCCTAHQRYCSRWLKVMCDIFLMFKHFLVSGLICRDNCKPLIGWFSRSSNKPGELSRSLIHLNGSCSAGAHGLNAAAFAWVPERFSEPITWAVTASDHFLLDRQGKHKSVSCCWEACEEKIGHWWNIYNNIVCLLSVAIFNYIYFYFFNLSV